MTRSAYLPRSNTARDGGPFRLRSRTGPEPWQTELRGTVDTARRALLTARSILDEPGVTEVAVFGRGAEFSTVRKEGDPYWCWTVQHSGPGAPLEGASAGEVGVREMPLAVKTEATV
jgi:hypothetical protein